MGWSTFEDRIALAISPIKMVTSAPSSLRSEYVKGLKVLLQSVSSYLARLARRYVACTVSDNVGCYHYTAHNDLALAATFGL